MPRGNSVFILKIRSLSQNEMLSYLKDLLSELQKLEQDVEKAPKELHDLANNLVNAKLIENPDKDIRVLSLCCICEVLRIYAPDDPYTDNDKLKVFQKICTLIRGLQTIELGSITEKNIIYILNSISTVKSCLVPVILEQKGYPEASDLVEQLFHSLLSVIDPTTSKEGIHPLQNSVFLF
jgi:sister chromatid cohesion protein PDS5